ncbi:oxidoreductase [Microbacterium aurum]|uniref:Oxidoreductase n=1 Tax=Microbacterium aurum TaxID=36805 RepID=A0A1P8U746_9MICO|nr:Gfo/Idh/MocA family oxidoreductase [Microbacterium aurum]APZ33919.1 oxidoreductase [Microbacterium aurum]MBM7827680.1 myo-inositol 2-dehydrogenase/D-chiro-inositol 1-dehydrogenase [Microbacterium aurum]
MQRFALLGAGFIGSVHARNLHLNKNIDFRVVYDVDGGRAQSIADEYGLTVAPTIDAVFDSGEIDAVLIASSTDMHAEHLRRAADAGVAALVEKPIDLDLVQATEVTRYVQASGIPAMVDFNRRFDRNHNELKRIIDGGEIGKVELIQMSGRGPSLPPLEYLRVSGGLMRDQTVHMFDLARWIVGTDPTHVFVTGSALSDAQVAEIGDIDTSVATLRFEDGTIAQIDSVRRTGYGYDERIEVMGSDGLVESGRQQVGAVSRYHGRHKTTDGLHEGWAQRVEATYATALDAFVNALETGSPLPNTLDDGLKAQAIAEAATRSLRTGQLEPIIYVQ